MGRLTTMRYTEFKKFRSVVSNIHIQEPEYPCEKCIVDVCCIIACEEFETWLNHASERRYNREKKGRKSSG